MKTIPTDVDTHAKLKDMAVSLGIPMYELLYHVFPVLEKYYRETVDNVVTFKSSQLETMRRGNEQED